MRPIHNPDTQKKQTVLMNLWENEFQDMESAVSATD